MSIAPGLPIVGKHCFVYCGDDHCDCDKNPRWRLPLSDGMTDMRSQPEQRTITLQDHIEEVAGSDDQGLKKAYTHYGDSWKKRGGVGAFMMLARKADRLELQLNKPPQWDILEHIARDTRAEGVIDDVRDLRRYLLLVQAEIVRQRIGMGNELVSPFFDGLLKDDKKQTISITGRYKRGGVALGMGILGLWDDLEEMARSAAWDVFVVARTMPGGAVISELRRHLLYTEALVQFKGIRLGVARDNR
jgi:hypothetical protein